jgi:hypothetical protein
VSADAVALLAALANDARLRVFAHVLLTGGTTTVVADACGLRDKDALKLLTRLESVGLVAKDGSNWVARPDVLRQAVTDAAPEQAPTVRDASDATDPETAAVLRAFLPRGRLDQIPAARSKRLVVLDHIARVFEPGVRYVEHDVNGRLEAFHPDYAALRRYLVDEGFLARDAGSYWRSGGTVDV